MAVPALLAPQQLPAMTPQAPPVGNPLPGGGSTSMPASGSPLHDDVRAYLATNPTAPPQQVAIAFKIPLPLAMRVTGDIAAERQAKPQQPGVPTVTQLPGDGTTSMPIAQPQPMTAAPSSSATPVTAVPPANMPTVASRTAPYIPTTQTDPPQAPPPSVPGSIPATQRGGGIGATLARFAPLALTLLAGSRNPGTGAALYRGYEGGVRAAACAGAPAAGVEGW